MVAFAFWFVVEFVGGGALWLVFEFAFFAAVTLGVNMNQAVARIGWSSSWPRSYSRSGLLSWARSGSVSWSSSCSGSGARSGAGSWAWSRSGVK